MPFSSIDGRIFGLYYLKWWHFYGWKKIQTIVDWIASSSIWNIQCILDFANFYRIFIKDYSKIATPLTCISEKDKFVWDEKDEKAFESFKKAFTSAPILVHADSSKPFFLEVDASDFALGSMLSQYGEDGWLHLIAYHYCKFSIVEINYEIHAKELLAIINAFRKWRHLLEGLNIPLRITRITHITRILSISWMQEF